MAIRNETTLLDLVRASEGTVVLDGAAWRTADLMVRARRAAGTFRSLGVRRGEGVLVVDDGGGADLLTALLGAWWVAARPTVVAGDIDVNRMESIREQTGTALIVQRGCPGSGRTLTFADLSSGASLADRTAACTPADVALDAISSGTTGRPKCVSYTHEALSWNARAYTDRLELTRHDVLYTSMPLSVVGVLGMVLLPGLLASATTHIGRLSGAEVARARQQIRAAVPTLIYGVPYTFDLLARQRGRRPGDQLRWAICSSAPLPPGTFDRVRDFLGVPPRNSYCLAEAATVTVNTSDELDELRHSVGKPLAGVDVLVEPTRPGARTGRLTIAGPSCGLGYRKGGALEPFPEGRVRTNDLGFLDRGVLTVTGRVDELVKVAGKHVDLGYVREVVSRCPGLGAFAVVIDQHDNLGDIPILLAEATSLTSSPREVIAFCRRELRDVEVPREVRVVEQIPRTATGKGPLRLQRQGG